MSESESVTTVLVAFGANVLVATAKSVAAAITGSPSMLAEAAHSWADSGNEVFLLVANRRSRRSPDSSHPLGYGREAYIWSLFAAMGLFFAGSAVSVSHGIQELLNPEPARDFFVGYVVLAASFIFEGASLLQSVRQARHEADSMRRDLVEHVMATSDPTLRAVVAEDSAALIGLVIAAAGLAGQQLSGSSFPDAIGSILVGLLLAVVAIILIDRNRWFLVGEEADPRVRDTILQALLDAPEVDRVTYLRLEIVGPRMVSILGHLQLTGDDGQSDLAVRLRTLEARLCVSPAVAGAVLTLSEPDEPRLLPDPGARHTSALDGYQRSMTTPANMPPDRPSNEAKNDQLDIADGQGDAYLRALVAMDEESGASVREAGPYIVAFVQEDAEGMYAMDAGNLTWREAARQADGHFEIAVADAADGRFVPGLEVSLALVEDGREVMSTPLPFLWHPFLHHYGANVALPGTGPYTVRAVIEPPRYMRHDPVNGKRYGERVEVEFPDQRFEPGRKPSPHAEPRGADAPYATA